MGSHLRVMNVEHHRERGESHTERPQRPGHPCGGTGSHPAYPSILFRCSFRHNPTLQEYRLLDVTAPVTKALLCPGTGEVPRGSSRTKFREDPFHALR